MVLNPKLEIPFANSNCHVYFSNKLKKKKATLTQGLSNQKDIGALCVNILCFGILLDWQTYGHPWIHANYNGINLPGSWNKVLVEQPKR